MDEILEVKLLWMSNGESGPADRRQTKLSAFFPKVCDQQTPNQNTEGDEPKG
jgi:hypothetical protein